MEDVKGRDAMGAMRVRRERVRAERRRNMVVVWEALLVMGFGALGGERFGGALIMSALGGFEVVTRATLV